MKARPNIGKHNAVAPNFVAKGTDNSGSGAVTYALPAGTQLNDILLLAIECDATDTLPVPSGWAHIPGSPFIDGSNTTQGNVLWKRHSGSEANVNVGDPGDHQEGYMLAIRGCVPSGNPWNVTNSGAAAAGTLLSPNTGLTTTREKTLVYMFVANGHDPAGPVTTYYGAWACASLTSVTERGDYHNNDGSGGGIGCADGVKATTGAVGNFTYSLIDNETSAWLAVAFAATGT
jgi:hypothetical protein